MRRLLSCATDHPCSWASHSTRRLAQQVECGLQDHVGALPDVLFNGIGQLEHVAVDLHFEAPSEHLPLER